jgi:uncharacterized protein (DUF885 family)
MRLALLFLLALALRAPARAGGATPEDSFRALSSHYFDSGLEKAKGSTIDECLRARTLLRALRSLPLEALSFDSQIDLEILARKLSEKIDFYVLEHGALDVPLPSPDWVDLGMMAFAGDPAGLVGAMAQVSAALRGPVRISLEAPRRAELVRATDAALSRAKDLRSILEKDHPAQKGWLRASAEYVEALARFRERLLELTPDANAPPKPTARQRYAHALRYTLMSDHTPESLLFLALQKYREALEALDRCARKIDPTKTWREIIEDCKEQDQFTKEELLEKARELALRARDFVVEKNLVTLPPEARNVRVEKGRRGMITPFGQYNGAYITAPLEGLDEKTLRERLRDNHRSWTALVAVHEAVPGHHLQFEVAKTLKDRSRIRRLANPSTYIEGWGLYCEEMMFQNGYFADGTRERLNALKMRLWRCARVLIDVGLQTGCMTQERAMDLLVQEVTLEPSSAKMEVEHYASRPTYFSGYLLGYLEFVRLRELAQKTLGDRFDQKKFHDELLQLGPLPLAQLHRAIEHWLATS